MPTSTLEINFHLLPLDLSCKGLADESGMQYCASDRWHMSVISHSKIVNAFGYLHGTTIQLPEEFRYSHSVKRGLRG